MSLINAVVLMVAAAFIIIGSIKKFTDPQPVNGGVVPGWQRIGVVVNGITAWLFMKDKDKDLNVKAPIFTWLPMHWFRSSRRLGIVISKTGWNVIDPIVGLAISCIIIYSTWSLPRQRLSGFDGVPSDLDTEKIIAELNRCRASKRSIISTSGPSALPTQLSPLTSSSTTSNRWRTSRTTLKDRLRKKRNQSDTLEFETATCQCHEHNEFGDAETPS